MNSLYWLTRLKRVRSEYGLCVVTLLFYYSYVFILYIIHTPFYFLCLFLYHSCDNYYIGYCNDTAYISDSLFNCTKNVVYHVIVTASTTTRGGTTVSRDRSPQFLLTQQPIFH